MQHLIITDINLHHSSLLLSHFTRYKKLIFKFNALVREGNRIAYKNIYLKISVKNFCMNLATFCSFKEC